MKNKLAFYGGKPLEENLDILFVTVPKRSPHIYFACQLPEGIARLKAAVQEVGFRSQCWDLDNDYFRSALYHPAIMDELDDYFREVWSRQYYGQKEAILSEEALHFYNTMISRWVDEIVRLNPKWLGVSIFTQGGIRGCMDVLDELRKRAPQIRVVVGGFCIDKWVGKDKPIRLGDHLRELGLVDYFVVSEGEIAIVELLKGNDTYPGINSYNPRQIDDLTALPTPDYSDFNFSRYAMPNPIDLSIFYPRITITGSRGCVKKCLFCDIANKWPRYRWVDPKALAHEMIHYYEKYRVVEFNWTDSIINASPPMLREFCQIVSDYQEANNVRFFSNGQFIIRDENHMPEEDFALLRKAGFVRVAFGVESGSASVRASMKKGVSDEAIRYMIQQCVAHGIKAECLVIIGYPTETAEDFLQTVNFVLENKPAHDGDDRVSFVISAFVMEHDWDESPLNRDPSLHEVTFDPIITWVSPHGSYYTALKRSQGLYAMMKGLGFRNFSEYETETLQAIAIIEERLREAGREAEILPAIEVLPDGTVRNLR